MLTTSWVYVQIIKNFHNWYVGVEIMEKKHCFKPTFNDRSQEYRIDMPIPALSAKRPRMVQAHHLSVILPRLVRTFRFSENLNLQRRSQRPEKRKYIHPNGK